MIWPNIRARKSKPAWNSPLQHTISSQAAVLGHSENIRSPGEDLSASVSQPLLINLVPVTWSLISKVLSLPSLSGIFPPSNPPPPRHCLAALIHAECSCSPASKLFPWLQNVWLWIPSKPIHNATLFLRESFHGKSKSQEEWHPAFAFLGHFRAFLEDFFILALKAGQRGHWGWCGVLRKMTTDESENWGLDPFMNDCDQKQVFWQSILNAIFLLHCLCDASSSISYIVLCSSFHFVISLSPCVSPSAPSAPIAGPLPPTPGCLLSHYLYPSQFLTLLPCGHLAGSQGSESAHLAPTCNPSCNPFLLLVCLSQLLVVIFSSRTIVLGKYLISPSIDAYPTHTEMECEMPWHLPIMLYDRSPGSFQSSPP